MRITFEITDAESARFAVSATTSLAVLFPGAVVAESATATARKPRGGKAADPVETYNTLAAAAGAATVPTTDPDPTLPLDKPAIAAAVAVAETPAPADTIPPAAPTAVDKDALLARLRPMCVEIGAERLKTEILDPHKVDRLSSLTVEQLQAVYDKLAAEAALR